MKLRYVVVAVVLLLACRAAADTGVQYIPKWHMRNDEACYSFADAKKLVELDAKLHLCTVQERVIPQLRLSNEKLERVVAMKDAETRLVLGEAAKLRDDKAALIKRNAELEAKQSGGPSVGWLVAGGTALTLVGVLLGVWAGS
jgi:hypothetical protein